MAGLSTLAGVGLSGINYTAAEARGADDPAIVKKRLILLGLNAMARSPEMSYFADGHRGAAMLSAHFMCVEHEFDDATCGRIVELFDLNWANSKLCRPFPEGEPVSNPVEQIGLALADGGKVLREVGHNVIFATLAIKAFRWMPEAATKERVDGICNLIRAFKPWRDVKPAEDVQPPPFDDSAAAARFILQETSSAIDRFVGFGQGFAGHMLTFGQSLVDLAAMGDVEWAESCRTAFRKYVTVTRLGPDSESRKIKDHPPSQLRPNELSYWQRRGDKTLGIGHVFKYPYGYYGLLDMCKDDELAKAVDAKAYHIF